MPATQCPLTQAALPPQLSPSVFPTLASTFEPAPPPFPGAPPDAPAAPAEPPAARPPAVPPVPTMPPPAPPPPEPFVPAAAPEAPPAGLPPLPAEPPPEPAPPNPAPPSVFKTAEPHPPAASATKTASHAPPSNRMRLEALEVSAHRERGQQTDRRVEVGVGLFARRRIGRVLGVEDELVGGLLKGGVAHRHGADACRADARHRVRLRVAVDVAACRVDVLDAPDAAARRGRRLGDVLEEVRVVGEKGHPGSGDAALVPAGVDAEPPGDAVRVVLVVHIVRAAVAGGRR